jgi:hypothetical protein
LRDFARRWVSNVAGIRCSTVSLAGDDAGVVLACWPSRSPTGRRMCVTAGLASLRAGSALEAFWTPARRRLCLRGSSAVAGPLLPERASGHRAPGCAGVLLTGGCGESAGRRAASGRARRSGAAPVAVSSGDASFTRAAPAMARRSRTADAGGATPISRQCLSRHVAQWRGRCFTRYQAARVARELRHHSTTAATRAVPPPRWPCGRKAALTPPPGARALLV